MSKTAHPDSGVRGLLFISPFLNRGARVPAKPYLAGTLALPWNESSDASTGNYVVTADVNVRKGAETGYAKLTYKQFTTNAQKQIKDIDSSCPEHFPKGIKVTISQVKEASNGSYWGKCPSGWICLKYASKADKGSFRQTARLPSCRHKD